MLDRLSVQAVEFRKEEDPSRVVLDKRDVIDRFAILNTRRELGEHARGFLSLGSPGQRRLRPERKADPECQADRERADA